MGSPETRTMRGESEGNSFAAQRDRDFARVLRSLKSPYNPLRSAESPDPDCGRIQVSPYLLGFCGVSGWRSQQR